MDSRRHGNVRRVLQPDTGRYLQPGLRGVVTKGQENRKGRQWRWKDARPYRARRWERLGILYVA